MLSEICFISYIWPCNRSSGKHQLSNFLNFEFHLTGYDEISFWSCEVVTLVKLLQKSIKHNVNDKLQSVVSRETDKSQNDGQNQTFSYILESSHR